MQRQIRYKRFMNAMSDLKLSLQCFWYAKSLRGIVSKGIENDSKQRRSDCIYT